MDKHTLLQHIEQELQKWGHRMVGKYPWLTIKYEFNEMEKVILVSFYGNHLDNSSEFSLDALAFENKMNTDYGDDAPLFCDNEEIFKLLGNVKVIKNKTNMTTELTIQAADNGMIVEMEEWMQVIENTHVTNGTGTENLIHELGKIFYEEISNSMDRDLSNKVKVRIEITKED